MEVEMPQSPGIVGILYMVVVIIMACFMIGSFLALPMIWLHVGRISKKLDKLIKLLESK
jgi:hypothetical protein